MEVHSGVNNPPEGSSAGGRTLPPCWDFSSSFFPRAPDFPASGFLVCFVFVFCFEHHWRGCQCFFTMEKLDTETCQVKKKTELEFLEDGVCSQSIRPPCLRGSIAVVNSTANATCTPPLREVRAPSRQGLKQRWWRRNPLTATFFYHPGPPARGTRPPVNWPYYCYGIVITSQDNATQAGLSSQIRCPPLGLCQGDNPIGTGGLVS